MLGVKVKMKDGIAETLDRNFGESGISTACKRDTRGQRAMRKSGS